ncbi:MAG: hypothetical protein Q9P01_04670 [Anaerolineae bacterium]|nr:hypothetical protein [Anaerolineae bacterium]
MPFAVSLDAINQVTEALLAVDALFGEAEVIETPEADTTVEVEATPQATIDAEATAEATIEVSDESDLNGQLAAFFGEGILIPCRCQ